MELKKQAKFEVDRVLVSICSNLNNTNSKIVCEAGSDGVQGSFDHFKITDALKWLSIGSLKYRQTGEPVITRVRRRLPEEVRSGPPCGRGASSGAGMYGRKAVDKGMPHREELGAWARPWS